MVLDIEDKKIEQKEQSINLPLRIWKIWWWDKEDKMHILYTKQMDEQTVIEFCKEKGITKYSVFNEKFKNVITDGERIPVRYRA